MPEIHEFEKKRKNWTELAADARAFAAAVFVVFTVLGLLLGAVAGRAVALMLVHDAANVGETGALIGLTAGGLIGAAIAKFATLALQLLAGILEALTEIEWNTTDDEPGAVQADRVEKSTVDGEA